MCIRDSHRSKRKMRRDSRRLLPLAVRQGEFPTFADSEPRRGLFLPIGRAGTAPLSGWTLGLELT
eukprot:1173839-Alexandrium_andersonii.AAC.1